MNAIYQLVDLVLWLAWLFLIIYVVLGLLISFGIVNPYNRFISGVYEALTRLMEPILRPIRKVLPNTAPVDLSPLVVFIVIWFLQILWRDNGRQLLGLV
jgi:YggT family protein